MNIIPRVLGATLLSAGLLLATTACGGGGPARLLPAEPTPAPSSPASTPSTPTPPDPSAGFTFHATAPHARDLFYDARDAAQPNYPAHGHRDVAGVVVYATLNGRKDVLLARRAPGPRCGTSSPSPTLNPRSAPARRPRTGPGRLPG